MRRFSALVVVFLASLAGCQKASAPSFKLADGKRPNVLLITIDTLRADHVGSDTANARGLTPSIDRLAAESVVFEQAEVTVPATLPSLASLHTGRYPGGQPVRTNGGRLQNVPVLAELLRAAGYTTGAFYGNDLLRRESGFSRGFVAYTSFVGVGGVLDARGAEQAIGWLDWPQPEPWFLWLHFMDPHGPYLEHPSRIGEAACPDPLADKVLPLSTTNYGLGVLPKYQQIAGLDHAAAYRKRYCGEIRFTDEQVGKVLAALDALKLRDRTIVVLAADHGEALGEHDLYFQHGWFPYEDSLRVPLLMRLPKPVARRVSEPVSLIDLMPTLLAGLEIEAPEGVEGRDLRPALNGGQLDPVPVFAVTAYRNQMTAIRRGPWKLVHTPKAPSDIGPSDPWAPYYAKEVSYALYDLSADRGETRDVTPAQKRRAEAMRRELSAWEAAHGVPMGRPEEVEIDPATRERLDALGYGS